MTALTRKFYWQSADNRGKDNQTVGVIGDTHLPFEHPRYLEFLIDTFWEWGVKIVVHIGDLVDNHAISFHDTDPDGMSAKDEYEMVKTRLPLWGDAFPYVDWCLGNHDRLPMRRMKKAGLPAHLLAQNYYMMPEGWKAAPGFVHDNVYYSHGIGNMGYGQMMDSKSMSAVIGHAHSGAGLLCKPTPTRFQFWMNVGCGIDIDAYAFEYAKDFPKRPVLACGIVKNGIGFLVPMDMDKYGRIE